VGVSGAPDLQTSWVGALAGEQRPDAERTIRAVIDGYGDGTYASLVLTDDGSRYWCKQLGNPQGDHVLVNEAVLAAAARLIGAPARPTTHLYIPPELAGEPFGPGLKFRTGIAHGSLHLDAAEERDEAAYVRRGDNAARWAAIVAAWDWLLGDDGQWLYDQANDYEVWTFDHGFWLGGDGGDWTGSMLARLLGAPWSWGKLPSGIDRSALHATAARLRQVSSSDVLGAVAQAHPSWGTSDAELETLAWFLYNRRASVATRLEAQAKDERRKS